VPELRAWVVDPLTKVFPTDRRSKTARASVTIEAARNEAESGQVVLRSAGGVTVRAVVSPLVHIDGDARIDSVRANFVGYVQVDPNDLAQPRRRSRAPLLFPDVLTDDAEMHLEGGRTHAVWLTVEVPPAARPGTYRGQLMLSAARETLAVPVELTVHEAVVPAARGLYVGQWLSADGPLARHIPGAVYPRDAFWATMRAIAQNMRAHRQNVLGVPFGPSVGGPIAAAPTGIDGLTFDFSGFDRLADVFIGAGVADVVMGWPLARRSADGGLMVRGLLNVGGCLATVDLKPDSPECRHFLRHYLTSLDRHLEFTGWRDRYVQPLCDGPTDGDPAGYRTLARAVRDRLTGVRIIEPLLETKMSERVDIRVPRLDHFLDRQRSYRERQLAGDQVWFYTANDLDGRYPNRFLDRSLLDVRLVHWMNFAFKATGYIHGGYNRWDVGDPLKPAGLAGPAGGKRTPPATLRRPSAPGPHARQGRRQDRHQLHQQHRHLPPNPTATPRTPRHLTRSRIPAVPGAPRP